MTVDADFPCDDPATAVVTELCPQPVASAVAPAEISSCPGSTLVLDGSRSSGGGSPPYDATSPHARAEVTGLAT